MTTLTYSLEDSVALLQMDDGKANAFTPEVLDALIEGLARARREASAVVIAGRDGFFSGGFDMKRMTASAESARSLVAHGGRMLLEAYLHPQPLIVAASGHALAAGALLVLTGDVRIGARGKFKLGLNEVAIGLRLPLFAFELARDRLAKSHLVRSTILGELHGPDAAVAAGYLDQVVEPEELLPTALATAKKLTELSVPAVGETKRVMRQQLADRARATLDEDLASIDLSILVKQPS